MARGLHPEAPDIAIVMGDPASPEVVRRAKVAKTGDGHGGVGRAHVR